MLINSIYFKLKVESDMNFLQKPKTYFFNLGLIFIFLCSSIGLLKNGNCYSSPYGKEISSFTEIRTFLEELPSDALVLFDLDETILVGRSAYLPPVLTESLLPDLIKNLQNRSIKTIALTNTMTFSNSSVFAAGQGWRDEDLLALGIDFTKSFEEFFIFDELPPYAEGYPILYNGILYSNRLPKGEVLMKFLDKVKDTFNPSLIVFFDDQIDNIIDVGKAAKQINVNYKGFLYNKISQWSEEGMSNEEIQEKLFNAALKIG